MNCINDDDDDGRDKTRSGASHWAWTGVRRAKMRSKARAIRTIRDPRTLQKARPKSGQEKQQDNDRDRLPFVISSLLFVINSLLRLSSSTFSLCD